MDILPKEIEDIIINDAKDMEAYEIHRKRMKILDKDINDKMLRYEDDYGGNHLFIAWVKDNHKTYKEIEVCKDCGDFIEVNNKPRKTWCDCYESEFEEGEFIDDDEESMSSEEGSIEF